MELSQAILKARNDPKYFAEKLLKIVYKGRPQEWRYFPSQDFVLKARLKQESQGKPVRLVILKARREGISTLVQGWLFHKVTTRPHRMGMVVSHELDSADEIAEISRRFWEFLPEGRRPSIPGSKLPHTKTMVFDKLRSKLRIETANDIQAGRSMAIDYLHCSEVAFWRDAKELLLGLLSCVNRDDPDSMVVIESTANGYGDAFHELVTKAQNGENDFELVFIPWFIDPRYQIQSEDFEATPEEEKLRTLYTFEGKRITLTDAQLNWRRWAIPNLCGGDKEKFKQEYPGSVDEAFLYSGRTRFNQERLREIEREARPSVFKGFINESKTLEGFEHKLEANDKGYLTIYEKAQHRAQYVLFADVSEGKEIKDRESDYSSVDVLRCDTLEQVAHWHGRIGPELLDDEIIKLARYYNNAFVGVEKNNMGYGVVADLKDVYPNLFINIQFDKNGNEITREYGWRTTLKTKPLMISGLSDVINDKEIRINNPGTFEELRRYTIHPDGSLGAPSGYFDDRVISLAGAVQMYLHVFNKPTEHEEDILEIEEDEDEF